jgi:hypothetical protein
MMADSQPSPSSSPMTVGGPASHIAGTSRSGQTTLCLGMGESRRGCLPVSNLF